MWVKRTNKIFLKKNCRHFWKSVRASQNLDFFFAYISQCIIIEKDFEIKCKKKCLKPSLCKWQKLGISRLPFKWLALHCLFSIQIATRSKILKVSKLLDEVWNLDWVMHNGKKWQFCAKVNWDLVAFYGTFQKTPIFFFSFFLVREVKRKKRKVKWGFRSNHGPNCVLRLRWPRV